MPQDKREAWFEKFWELVDASENYSTIDERITAREKLEEYVTQYHQDLIDEVVEKCINEVNHYRATPRLRRDFCEWCDEVLLPGDKCDCKTETVRQELMDLINMDLKTLTETQTIIKSK